MKRMNTITWKAAGALALLALALPVAAQQATETNNNVAPTEPPETDAPAAAAANAGATLGKIQGSGQLLGKPVYSSNNQNVGTLKDLVVDVESGRVLYGVVTTSQGDVAVAPQVFRPLANDRLTLKVGAQKVLNAPRFTPQINQAGQIAKADFVAKVYQHFGQSAWWQGGTPTGEGAFHNVQKHSTLIGMKVEGVQNQSLGKIASMQLDMNHGRIAYLVLNPDPSLGLGNNYYALPPQAFTLSPDQKHLVSNIDKQKLASAPSVDRNTWSKLADPTFASQVYQYYGKAPYFGGELQPTGR